MKEYQLSLLLEEPINNPNVVRCCSCHRIGPAKLCLNGVVSTTKHVCCYICAEDFAQKVGQVLTGYTRSFNNKGDPIVIYTASEPKQR